MHLADALLAQMNVDKYHGSCVCTGLPYVNPGENIWISVPRSKIHGIYKIIEIILALDIHSLVGYGHETVYSKETIYRDVCQAIALSNVNLATAVKKDDEITGAVVFSKKSFIPSKSK